MESPVRAYFDQIIWSRNTHPKCRQWNWVAFHIKGPKETFCLLASMFSFKSLYVLATTCFFHWHYIQLQQASSVYWRPVALQKPSRFLVPGIHCWYVYGYRWRNYWILGLFGVKQPMLGYLHHIVQSNLINPPWVCIVTPSGLFIYRTPMQHIKWKERTNSDLWPPCVHCAIWEASTTNNMYSHKIIMIIRHFSVSQLWYTECKRS